MIHSAEGVLLDSAKRILVDSNILIAFFDTRHKLHDKVYSRLIPVYVAGAEFYYVQPCLLEFKEYWRRKIMTECIELRIQENYYFYSEFRKCYNAAKEKNGSDLYLKDYQVKALRATLENVAKGKGVQYWFDFCNQALTNTLSTLETNLAKTNFNYAKFDDGKLFPITLKAQWPKWQTADQMQEKYGLASSDAAILNMTNSAQGVDSFLTNDGDALFAVMNGALNAHINTYTFLDTSAYS